MSKSYKYHELSESSQKIAKRNKKMCLDCVRRLTRSDLKRWDMSDFDFHEDGSIHTDSDCVYYEDGKNVLTRI